MSTDRRREFDPGSAIWGIECPPGTGSGLKTSDSRPSGPAPNVLGCWQHQWRGRLERTMGRCKLCVCNEQGRIVFIHSATLRTVVSIASGTGRALASRARHAKRDRADRWCRSETCQEDDVKERVLGRCQGGSWNTTPFRKHGSQDSGFGIQEFNLQPFNLQPATGEFFLRKPHCPPYIQKYNHLIICIIMHHYST